MARLSLIVILGFTLSFATSAAQDLPPAEKKDEPAYEKLLLQLGSSDPVERFKAHAELTRRRDAVQGTVDRFLANEELSPEERIQAIAVLATKWNADALSKVTARLQDPAAGVRIVACQVLGILADKSDRTVREGLVQNLSDSNVEVAAAAYGAVGRLAFPGAEDVIVNGIQFDSGSDGTLREAMIRAAEAVGKSAFNKLLALADSGNEKDLERVIEIFPHFRSAEAGERLGILLNNYHLTAGQLVPLIESYKLYKVEPPINAAPLRKVIENLLEENVRGNERDKESLRRVLFDVLKKRSPAFAAWIQEGMKHWEENGLIRKYPPAKETDLVAKPSVAFRAMLQELGSEKLAAILPSLMKDLEKCPATEGIWILYTLGELKDARCWDELVRFVSDYRNAQILRIQAWASLLSIDAERARSLAERNPSILLRRD